jgi:hypothetical protein
MRRFIQRLFKVGLLFALGLLICLSVIALSTHFTLQLEKKSFGHMTHWGSSFARIAEFEKWAKQKPANNTPANASSPARGLIIGSSTAYRNLNPHIFSTQTGIDWFNYGSSGQSPKVNLFMLKHAFSQTKIDYVLLDIYSGVAQLEGLESAHDLIYNSNLDGWLKTQLVCKYPNGKLLLRYLYFYTKQIIPSKKHIIHDPQNGTYLQKGFVCSNQPALKNFKKAKSKQRVPFIKELPAIAALCRQHGARLILNIAPSLEGPQILDPAYRAYRCIENREVQNPTWFYDSHHMTCEGANLYSEGVVRKLVKQLK